MMQMNFNFSPAGMTVVGQQLHESLVLLFSWIEVGVDKRSPIVVPPTIHGLGILAAPPFQAAFLLGPGDTLFAPFRINCRLEMIGHRDHEMYGTTRRRA